MRERLIVLLILASALALIVRLWFAARARRVARERLSEGLAALQPEPEETSGDQPPTAQPFLRRHRLAPWITGAIIGAVVYFVLGLKILYAVMFGAIVALLLHETEEMWAARLTLRIELQLADAIDLMVGSLRAGGGVLQSLEHALEESRYPLRPQLEEVLGRIRYGDDPQTVYRGLTARVPLEAFRLFASALSVHGEVGGSLAPTLASVGRIIRDRIELSRRIQSMTVQSRTSIIAVLGTTYFIGLLMWRTDPQRMEAFLGTSYGSAFFSGAVILQGIGVFWCSALSRLKY
jgi:tight adherence protein B